MVARRPSRISLFAAIASFSLSALRHHQSLLLYLVLACFFSSNNIHLYLSMSLEDQKYLNRHECKYFRTICKPYKYVLSRRKVSRKLFQLLTVALSSRPNPKAKEARTSTSRRSQKTRLRLEEILLSPRGSPFSQFIPSRRRWLGRKRQRKTMHLDGTVVVAGCIVREMRRR